MEDFKSENISLFRAVNYCIWVAFCPKKLENTEIETDISDSSANIVTYALWSSLIWVIVSIVIGYAFAKGLGLIFQNSAAILARVLQIIGAVILLWATLFVRGWDIQTFDGSTITEKVNRWIFRFLYCLGTALIVTSVAIL